MGEWMADNETSTADALREAAELLRMAATAIERYQDENRELRDLVDRLASETKPEGVTLAVRSPRAPYKAVTGADPFGDYCEPLRLLVDADDRHWWASTDHDGDRWVPISPSLYEALIEHHESEEDPHG